jgi:DNA-binding response OmpR family regulator
MDPRKDLNTTILFLASDAPIRKVISEVLDSEGYVVMPASDVAGAVDQLKESSPDLLIVRHYTEGISGHDAAMYLRTMCPGIPVLLLGGLLDDDRLENPELLEGFEIFPKPFEAAELLEKVKDVLVKHSTRNKAARKAE